MPLAIAVIAIPITARGLGAVRFGLLGLAWALVEYLSFVDLALGRTSVRYVADALARGDRGLRQIVSIAVVAQGAAGVVAAIGLALAAQYLAFSLFSIPEQLRPEAAAMFRAVAGNLAIVVLIAALRGVLEGARRFDLSNGIRIPSAVAGLLIPAAGAVAGWSLGAILWSVFVARLMLLVAACVVVPRALPEFRWETPREWRLLRGMFSYSAWLAVSAVVNPLLVAFDRFVLAALLGAAAVGYYTAPYEAASRLLMVASSAFVVLFPAITAEYARKESWRTQRVLESVLRQMALGLGMLVVVLFVFAPELLRAWLGQRFAIPGALPFRILLLGVAANALAHMPFVYLYATGRPDLPAKNHVAELAFHVPLTLLLVRRFGVAGAAAAWTVRVWIDAALLFWQAGSRGALRTPRATGRYWVATVVALAVLSVVLEVVDRAIENQPYVSVLLSAATLGAFVVASWWKALAPEERASWVGLLAPVRRRFARTRD